MMQINKFLKPITIANDEKQPSPQLQLILFGIGWLGLNVIALLVSLIVRSFLTASIADPIELENALRHISFGATVNIVAYIVLLSILSIVTFPTIKHFIKNFIRLSHIFKGIGYGALVLLAGIALNSLYLVFEINLSDNANESTITSIMRNYPLFSFIAFVIAGPVCEEITYRLGLFGLLGRFNRLVAYGVTLVFFGLIHFDFTTTNLINELLNLPFYLIAGLIFCYVYEKEGLAIAMYAHITNNLVSFVFSVIGTDFIIRMF